MLALGLQKLAAPIFPDSGQFDSILMTFPSLLVLARLITSPRPTESQTVPAIFQVLLGLYDTCYRQEVPEHLGEKQG